MIYLLYTLHIIVCLFLILVVLLQQGKGADLSVFGGGSTQTAFGARSAATVLHKLTVASFIVFILTTVGIAAFQRQAGDGGSVMSDVVEEEVRDDAEAPVPAAEESALDEAIEVENEDVTPLQEGPSDQPDPEPEVPPEVP